MTAVCLALITAPDEEIARQLARTLVTEQLAACVNCVPRITSIYTWEGTLHEDSEVLLIVKTTQPCVTRLTSRVIELHPYAVPEVVVVPVSAGSEPYLDWVTSQVR